MPDRVLITTDDLEQAVRVNANLEQAGIDTAMVSSLDDVRQAVRGREQGAGSREPDAIVLTGGLHESTAQRLLAAAHEHSVSTLGLVEATDDDPDRIGGELGLTAWLVKPADPAEVTATVRRLIERRRLQQRTGILGESAAIQEVLVKIEQMAPVTSTVLIEGESGTGKELVARAIHDLSPRGGAGGGGRGKAFIAVNCAALPETLLESELFGHEKGAFTGAAERRLGRFELANGGTILLDEVGEMPPATQVKLLRVLEDRSFFRVGGTQPIQVDVRVIAATNQSLKEAVTLGTFRDDLFYRLNVLSIYLPPLRERRSDIPLLVRTFIAEFSKTHDRTFKGITGEALHILVDADWPGNVRQLRNLIESMVVLAPEGEIRASDIPRDIRERTRTLPVRIAPPAQSREVAGQELEFIFRTLVELKVQLEDLRRRIEVRPSERVEVIEVGGSARVDPLDSTPEPDQPLIYKPGMSMADVERAAIDAALRETHGNRRKAAETLGIGERTLYRKLKEYAID
ncbi:MAG TPA: sigma-54 dependent transcriptional regulator [Gemmatimonadales bacterium]|nr:sigma-54 dependent transcriptional regulator [Gemmatimonadales bacterium]